MPKNNIKRFIIWLCSKFTKNELEQIVDELKIILSSKNYEIKPKDNFKEQHPNYRNFSVDPLPPKKENENIVLKKKTTKNY
jgi:hypothetical protein